MFITVSKVKAIVEASATGHDPLDYCPHVTSADDGNVVGAYMESDSFGPVSIFVVCQSCIDVEMDDEESPEGEFSPEPCTYCGEEKPQGETISYLPYYSEDDFGIVVCLSCADKPEHREIVRQDKENLELIEELSQDEDGWEDDEFVEGDDTDVMRGVFLNLDTDQSLEADDDGFTDSDDREDEEEDAPW